VVWQVGRNLFCAAVDNKEFKASYHHVDPPKKLAADSANWRGLSPRGCEFVTRLYFLNLHFPKKIARAFDQQRMEVETHSVRLKKMCDELPPEQIYNRMSLEMRLKQLKLALEWLDECQEHLQQITKT